MLKEEFDRNGNVVKVDFLPSADMLRFAALRSSLKNDAKSDADLLKELSIPKNSLNKWETEYGAHFRSWLYRFIENTRGPIRDALFAFGLDQAFNGNFNYWKEVSRTVGAISGEKVEVKATISRGVDELAELPDGAIEAEYRKLISELTGASLEGEVPALEGNNGGGREGDKMELALCKKNPHHFIFNWLKTEDAQDGEAPYKLFPKSPHLAVFVTYWMRYKRLCVPKSRQMTISWITVACYLWETMFYPSRMSFFTGRKEEDSEALIERTFFMYDGLPQFFRSFVKCQRTHCNLKFSNRSEIKGVAQGGDQFRSYTLSGVFIDEAAKQSEMSEMIKAAIPAVGQNGRITVVSSAAPSSFADLVFDRG